MFLKLIKLVIECSYGWWCSSISVLRVCIVLCLDTAKQTKCFKDAVTTQQLCVNITSISLWQHILVFFKWSQLDTHYFLVYLFQLLYMDRVTMYPSSRELTICMRHWRLSVLLVGMRPVSSQPADQTAIHTERKIPVSHRYSKFCWWWAHSCLNHAQKLK